MSDSGDPHGGMSCTEVEDWADDMCGDINEVTHLLARHGYVPVAPDEDLFGRVFNALCLAAVNGQWTRLAPRVPEEWFA